MLALYDILQKVSPECTVLGPRVVKISETVRGPGTPSIQRAGTASRRRHPSLCGAQEGRERYLSGLRVLRLRLGARSDPRGSF